MYRGFANGEPVVILLVEDDEAHAKLMLRSFEEQRIANRIVHVPDGETAIDYLFRRGDYAERQSSPRPHLILLDIRLPGIDGLDVLREVKASRELSPIPVVIITSSQAERDMTVAYEEHVNSYLLKPLDFEKFQQLMNDLGFYWLVWNHYPGKRE